MKREPGNYSRLTARQAELLSFLRMRDREGNTPSLEEMKDALGAASKSVAHRLLNGLEERGYIVRAAHRARHITVYSEPVQPVTIPTPHELQRVPMAAMLEELNRRGFRAVRST